jgi:hypothetical protein
VVTTGWGSTARHKVYIAMESLSETATIDERGLIAYVHHQNTDTKMNTNNTFYIIAVGY